MITPYRWLLGFLVGCTLALQAATAAENRVFEMRTYITAPGRLDALSTRFRDHTCKLFEKHGITNVGYWTPLDAADGAGTTLVYLLSYPSREAAKASWAAFNSDPEWQTARKASEASGKIVAKIESVFLEPTDYSPAPSATVKGQPGRVFELRTYTTPEGKIDALNARFRDHTCTLFQKHGMALVGFWVPTDAANGAGRTLTYLLAHADRDAAVASWKNFRADPAWVAAKAASEKDGSLTAPGGVKSVFLTATDFSAIK